MAVDPFVVLLGRLERDLRGEFPAWQIGRDESGNWSALRRGWPVMVTASAMELREGLRRLTAGGRRDRGGLPWKAG